MKIENVLNKKNCQRFNVCDRTGWNWQNRIYIEKSLMRIALIHKQENELMMRNNHIVWTTGWKWYSVANQDSALVHVILKNSLMIMKWFFRMIIHLVTEQRGAYVFKEKYIKSWPVNSPDLKLIENIRLTLKKKVHEKAPSTKDECSGYDTKLDLLVRLQSWSFVEWGVPLHCHYSQVHSDLE